MIGIILAGGTGTRLWPVSRTLFPKQFLRLDGKKSFFQQTVIRNLEVVPIENLYVITHEMYLHEVLSQLCEISSILKKNILLEPEQRNTAPAIAFALKMLTNPQEQEIIFVTPSDHILAPLEPFRRGVERACQLAERGKIVTFGIRPTHPETGYGYIYAKDECVESFIEKPNRKLAEEYVQDGNYFWNSGMFVFSSQTMWDEINRYCPELIKNLNNYSACPHISLDYAVMEKTEHLAMVPLSVSWSDVGSWENVYETLEKDDNANVLRGDVVAYETKRSLILAEKRLVATIGLEDFLLVETADVVLATTKKHAQQVKELVNQLKKSGRKEIDEHLTIHRPWGSYTILEEGDRYKIKRIHVNPEQKLSLQLHYHRSEHWVVVTGTAAVTIGAEESIVHEGESIFVPKSAVHRVENPGKVPLEIIEVQVGEYLGEDDIVRFDDIYGREKRKSEEFFIHS